MPRTLLLLSKRTTAPLRRPGKAGVNVTDSVQAWGGEEVRIADKQVDELETPAKSRPDFPSVSTSTVATVPAVCAVTVTLCALEITPTGCRVLKTPFCAHAPDVASSKAASTAGLPRRLRLAVNAFRGKAIAGGGAPTSLPAARP